MRSIAAFLLVATFVLSSTSHTAAERALSNDNRTPSGRLIGDTLVLRLTVRVAD